MIIGLPAARLLPALWRMVTSLGPAAAVVAILVSPAAAHVATTVSPLITIPPAKLPPLPTADATASAVATPTPAPRELLPTELQILRDPQGTGLAMYGALTGKTDSAAGALLAVLTRSPPFQPAAASQLMLTDQSDRRAQALFTATVRGAPVIGIAVAALDGPGGDIAVFYDDAGAFPASFLRLRRALAPSGMIEIGVSDNSVYEADSAAKNNADANWDQAIAAVAKDGEAPIDPELARTIADRLASDTGRRWRIVSPAAPR